MFKIILKFYNWLLNIGPFILFIIAILLGTEKPTEISKYQNQIFMMSVFLYLMKIEVNNKLIGILYSPAPEIKKSIPPKSGSGVPKKK